MVLTLTFFESFESFGYYTTIQADLLVINKTDLAEAVGADLEVMRRDSLRMRDGGPFEFCQVRRRLF